MRVCPLCLREVGAAEATCPHDGAAPFDSIGGGEDPATLPKARRLGGAGANVDSGPPPGPPPLEEQLPAGALLGKVYRVERLIGYGGMGAVYEVEHLRLQKRFAAKVLRREYTGDAQALARFEREAVAASRIHHPNIVEVVNLDEEEGRAFIVEELLVGQDLSQLARGVALPLPLALSVGITVARALDAAHAAGIVHRDLKPANIFLAKKQGRIEVKILDFGISKVIAEGGRVALTETGGFLGTPLYMAPEQAKEGGVVDARTDVYALGVILYELLAGAPPFTSRNPMDLALKHVMEPPPPLVERNPEVPLGVAEVVMGALAKDPSARPASMGAFADALETQARQAQIPVPAASERVRLTVAATTLPAAGREGALATSAGARRSVWALLVFGLAAASFLGVVAFLGDRPPPSLPGPAQPLPTLPGPPARVTTATVGLELNTDPPGAEVELDGAVRGHSPGRYTWPSGPGEVQVVLHKPGFLPERRRIPRDRSSHLELRLTPVPPAKKRVVTPDPGATTNDLPEAR